MKKRKVKLFASIASLAMVVAVMGVGVWAASQQAVKIQSTVQYTAVAIAADVYVQVADTTTGAGQEDILGAATWGSAVTYEGGDAATSDDAKAHNLKIASFAADTEYAAATQQTLAITLADANEDGKLLAGDSITYTFKIDGTGDSISTIHYSFVVNSPSSLFNVQINSLTQGVLTTTGDTTTSNGDATITVTFSLIENQVANINENTVLANFGIGLANTAEKAAALTTAMFAPVSP